MDATAAMIAATNALGALSESVTADDWKAALSASVIPDTANRWPNTDGWVASHDAWWLAAEAVNALALRAMGTGVVTKWQSEGTTVESTPADLFAMARAFRAKSTVPQSAELFTAVAVLGDATGYDPRSQAWAGERRTPVLGNWS